MIGCSDQGSDILYFSSFESKNDLSPWDGVNELMLSRSAAPNGGYRSLRVGGGCLQPIATLPLQVDADGFYRLTCWARMIENNDAGIVVRKAHDFEPVAQIQISGRDWKSYASRDTFFAGAGDSLTLEIFCGGIILSEAEIDLLTIEKVD